MRRGAGSERGGVGGFGWDPPSSYGPPMVPARLPSPCRLGGPCAEWHHPCFSAVPNTGTKLGKGGEQLGGNRGKLCPTRLAH